jgi:hypothetical protein
VDEYIAEPLRKKGGDVALRMADLLRRDSREQTLLGKACAIFPRLQNALEKYETENSFFFQIAKTW